MIDAAAAAMSGEELRDEGGGADVQKSMGAWLDRRESQLVDRLAGSIGFATRTSARAYLEMFYPFAQ
jgi:hypothetical protein